jgi:hypothetical protein
MMSFMLLSKLEFDADAITMSLFMRSDILYIYVLHICHSLGINQVNHSLYLRREAAASVCRERRDS